MVLKLPVSLPMVEAARSRIAKIAIETPLLLSESLSARCGNRVYLKPDHRQPGGAFKLRGAANAVLSLSRDQASRGVVTASTGNHGRALALAASCQGIPVTVCLSELVPQNKVDAVRDSGARVVIVGKSQDDAEAEAIRLGEMERLHYVPPFDAPEVVAGQGTIGLEIADDLPDVDTVLVPLSGGGLAAGVALALKARSPRVRVIGISMRRGAAMQASLAARHPVQVEEMPTLADSLGGGIGPANRVTFGLCQALLDDVVLLDEAEIAQGIRHAYASEREIIEGAAAVGIAALITGIVQPRGPAVVLLTGRNIDMTLHRAVINGADGLPERGL